MSFYHFVIKTVPKDGGPVKKLKVSLTNDVLLRGALLLVGSKCTTSCPKRSYDDNDKAFDYMLIPVQEKTLFHGLWQFVATDTA
jgi:hypothetical protein